MACRRNLAPFSFFTVASVNPPVLCFSPLINDECVEKDTLVNIRQTGEFVVNVVNYDLAGRMNQTSAPYPNDISEFVKAGVTTKPSTVVKAPGVQESLVRFECTLQQIISFGSEPLAGNLVLLLSDAYAKAVSLRDRRRGAQGIYEARFEDRLAVQPSAVEMKSREA